MSRPILTVLLGAGLAFQSLPATAGPAFCAERTQIAERLTTAYSEQLAGGGLQSSNGLIEVWTTETGSTWTILMTRPDGISCVMATGTNWATHEPAILPSGVAG
jgi:hypothetical protein